MRKYTAASIVAAAAVSFTPAPVATATTTQFSDVNEKAIQVKGMRDAVYKLTSVGAIIGYSDGNFKPDLSGTNGHHPDKGTELGNPERYQRDQLEIQ